VRLKDGRTVWVKLHRWGEQRDYQAPQVFAEPLPTDRAIIAALAVLEARPVDPKRVPVVLRIRDALRDIADGAARDLNEVALTDPVLKSAKVSDLYATDDLVLPIALLRHYRNTDFETVSEEERVAMLQRLCGHLKELLEAAYKVQAFLESGGPKGLPTSRVREIERCMVAAELKDALRLSYREVGEALKIPLDAEYYALKGSNKRAEDMVRRGRELLVQVLGDEETYDMHLEAIRPALDRWHSLLKVVEERPHSGARVFAELLENQPNLLKILLPEKELKEYNDEPLGLGRSSQGETPVR